MRIGVLEQARASFAQRSWGDAYAQLATADAPSPLSLDDLEKLALAAYLTGREEESTVAWTRAHHEAIRRDDPQRATRNAFLIGSGLMFRGETAPGLGWFARGGRVLEGCGECPEQAWPRTWNAFAEMWSRGTSSRTSAPPSGPGPTVSVPPTGRRPRRRSRCSVLVARGGRRRPGCVEPGGAPGRDAPFFAQKDTA
jgi:hypothetical protein